MLRIDPYILEIFSVIAKNPSGMHGIILRLSDQAIEDALKTLELFAGTKLFNIRDGVYELTPAGREVAEFADRIISVYDEMEMRLRYFPQLLHGTMSIGIASDYSTILRRYVLEFKRQHPNTNCKIHYGISEEDLIEKVVSKELTYAIVKSIGFISGEVTGIKFFESELVETFWLIWRKDLEVREIEKEFINQFGDRS